MCIATLPSLAVLSLVAAPRGGMTRVGCLRMAAQPTNPLPQLEALGVEGRRAALLVYCDDRAPNAQSTLKELQRMSDDYKRRGCAMVAVRQSADEETPPRFPGVRFELGLEELSDLRGALGLDELKKVKHYPRAYLIDPDGKLLAAADEVRAVETVFVITRALHAVTVDTLAEEEEEEELSFWEDEARRQRAWKEGREWEQALEEDESLRQPTRGWFSGVLDGPSAPSLSPSQQRMLAEAGAPPLVSKDGVQAPDWYALAKQKADAAAAEEDAAAARMRADPTRGAAASPTIKEWLSPLFGGDTTPPPPPPPPPLSSPPSAPPQAAAEGSGKGYDERVAELERLVQQARADMDGKNAAVPSPPPPPPPPSAAEIASALERAGMLAQGLSRSGTTKESRRRLRLLRELDSAIAELEREGFADEEVLAPLKEQAAAAWATAPPDALTEKEQAVAAAERARRGLTARDVAQMMSGAVPAFELEFDLAKWRLRLKGRGE